MTKARFSAWLPWFAVLLAAMGVARGQVQGPGGHYYQVVALQQGVTWEQARALAEQSTYNGVHGHLATITSAEEDQFIESLRIEAAPGGYNAVWVGGFQDMDYSSPTDGWYWVNGEGAIATSTVQGGYSNWQAGEPNDYWGLQSENYLAVGHFNNFGWNDYRDDGSVHGYVVEYPNAGRASVVKVWSPDPIAIEHSGENSPTPSPLDTARFVFTRTGNLTLDLPVYYTVHGTAVNGVDYNEITRSVIIPAGQAEVTLTIVPRVDVLTVVEPMETVGIRIEPSLILTPSAAYDINPNGCEAGAVIYEDAVDYPDSAELAVPRNGFSYRHGETVTMLVAVDHSAHPVTKVEFFAGAGLLGALTPTEPLLGLEFFKFNWTSAPVGTHEVRARVTLSSGAQLTTRASGIKVEGAQPLPTVGIRFMEPTTTVPVPDADYAPGYIAVVRDNANTAEDLQVFYSIGGTATAGVDYEELPGYVVIPAGRTGAKILVTAKDDTIDEPNETVILTLIPPPDAPANPIDASDAYNIDPGFKVAEVKILDNDEPPVPTETVVRILAADAEATEFPPTADGFNPARFVIERIGSTAQDLQVFFSIHGTAKNGEDYERIASPITIPAGKPIVAIQIVPLSDRGALTHKYEIAPEAGLSWEQARIKAEQAIYEGVHGHLATITSAEEDQLIETLRQEAGNLNLWVGGYQDAGETSKTEGWKWVNNEGAIPGSNNTQHGYANWLAGEPNDYWGPASENHMVIGWTGSFGWNDQGGNIGAQGYVMEFDLFVPDPESEEAMETVGIRLEPSPVMSPLPTYFIDSTYPDAAAVIFDGAAPSNGAIEVAIPSPEAVYGAGAAVEFLVAACHPTVDVQLVEFFVDDVKVGSSLVERSRPAQGGVIEHRLKWNAPRAGRHILQAKAGLAGTVLLSSPIPFTVEGDNNTPPVATLTKPADGSVYIDGDYETIVGSAIDPDGTVVKIEILLDGNVIVSKNGSAIEHRFSPAVGPHTIAIRATDDKGATDISEVANILVRDRHEVAFVHRELPGAYSPGVTFVVELRADPPEGTFAYAVEDRAPTGWRVTEVSDDGAFDTINGKVKFGPFFDDLPRTLTYRVTPPASAAGTFEFSGSGSVNGAVYPITGDATVELARQYHPADSNQDFRIILSEVTAYAAAWKAGDSWPAGPVPIPLSYVTRAHHIWRRGETYAFNPAAGAPPACWVPTTGGAGGFKIATVGGAQRSLFGDMRADAATQVRISATPASDSSGYAVEEQPPHGWTVSNISHEGVFDPARGVIRWGVFSDGAARTLSYTATPPPTVSSVGVFAGQLSYDGKLLLIGAGGNFDNSVTINGTAPVTMSSELAPPGFKLNISGPSGQTGVIEASTDFTNWTEVKSIFIPNGSVEFTDESPAVGRRFYRLRVQ